ncbi:amidohydrolase, partial [Bordetella holmesii]|nr:amidohydrolase [Bordetella holmesii]
TKIIGLWSSDVGDWVVAELSAPLAESWVLVEQGVISAAVFKAFVFGNPYRFYTEAMPAFLVGTVVERKLASQGKAG